MLRFFFEGGGRARWPGKCRAQLLCFLDVGLQCLSNCMFLGEMLACNVRHLGRTHRLFVFASLSAWVLLAFGVNLAHFGLGCWLRWTQCLFSVWHFGIFMIVAVARRCSFLSGGACWSSVLTSATLERNLCRAEHVVDFRLATWALTLAALSTACAFSRSCLFACACALLRCASYRRQRCQDQDVHVWHLALEKLLRWHFGLYCLAHKASYHSGLHSSDFRICFCQSVGAHSARRSLPCILDVGVSDGETGVNKLKTGCRPSQFSCHPQLAFGHSAGHHEPNKQSDTHASPRPRSDEPAFPRAAVDFLQAVVICGRAAC